MKPPPYDLVVVGGGITGAGVARDAALRGLRVALFEKTDYGAGTSSKSSKLIHGGLRYLEHGEIALVFESVSERRVQSRVAPHLVVPMPFLVPIYKGDRVGLETMNIGLWIYDGLALFRSPGLHKTHRGEAAHRIEPRLRQDGLRGAIEYYDCVTDDARLVLENLLDAEQAGALCKNHTEVIQLERRRGTVSAVVVRDGRTGRLERIETRSVVIAAGPWTDRVADALDVGMERAILRPTKGVHLVFERAVLPLERAITVISPIDGRVMFAIPWRGRIVLGTTDTDFAGSPDQVWAEPADAAYLCDSANKTFPGAHFSPDKVIATWAGLRPLIHEEAETASDVSREHQIYVRDDGVVIVAGGKLTTYRLMAKQTVQAALSWLRDTGSDVFEGRTVVRSDTRDRPLPGARGLSQPGPGGVARLADELAARHDLAAGTAQHLASVYGSRAALVIDLMKRDLRLAQPMQRDLPYLWAEVTFAVLHEHARTVDDVLARRVPLLLLGLDQGLDVAPRTAELMGDLLDWSAEERARELAHYAETVAESRRFRGEQVATPEIGRSVGLPSGVS